MIDQQAPTSVSLNPPKPVTGVAVRPAAVLATGANRLDVANTAGLGLATRAFSTFVAAAPLPAAARAAALQQVDQDLVKEGLLDKVGGNVSPAAQAALGWTREMAMPTPGVLVKGCLDECDVCEPELNQKIALDLVRMDLQNQLLQKQIDLLEKSQQYRCCPADEEETAAPAP